jgi:hypothetical protein
MKHLKCIPRVGVLVFALFSIGAKSESCQPSGSQSNQTSQPNQNTVKPWCHNDPPIFCAAFCSGYDNVTFTKECSDIGADILELQFEIKVMELYQERVDLGEHLCTQLDPSNFVTPCQVFIIPQEHPNQSHESCEPVPPGCPMF